MKSWGIADSLKLYNIENWGDNYFNVNLAGNLTVHPKQTAGQGIDLMQVVEDIKSQQGLGLPVIIRFQDILRNRVVTLNESFKKAIQEANYKGQYRGVYPIKVNQMREVVEEILDAGQPYGFGLEAGSKSELAAVLAMDTPAHALIICNGYKDYAFIKMALMGNKLGKNVMVVVEKLTDLYQTVAIAKELGVMPMIGVRFKLASRGAGKWENSSGDMAKFGLTTPELIHAVEYLKSEGMERAFKLLHFHIGSQISNIRVIKDAVKEATRVYAKLIKIGMNLEYIDVGGGLGVDYDGSRTNFASSMNYSLQEYCNDVVYSIQEVCSNEEVPEPNIVSESGRALVAHHSVLVVNVFGNIEVGFNPAVLNESDDEADVVKEMRYLFKNLNLKNMVESFNEAATRKEEALSMFKLGFLHLEDRAKVENIYWQICKLLAKESNDLKYVPEDVAELHKYLSDQYLCNFSLFQSMPDHWAIQQLFPIVPLHRLNEEPQRDATLADITCDSDGKVSKFIDLRDIKDTLKVHQLKDNEPYYLGFFLMGAYQDIMGDLHNLFGRVNEVHVFMDDSEPGGYYIEEVIRGNDIAGVLSWIQYNAATLEKNIKERIDLKVREGVIKPKEGVDLLKFYENILFGYTYMNYEKPVPMIPSAATTVVIPNAPQEVQ